MPDSKLSSLRWRGGGGTQLHHMEMLGLCFCHLGAAGETEAKKEAQLMPLLL